jgi:putative DNA primase/helicase
MTLTIPSSIATIVKLTPIPKEANGKDWGKLPDGLAQDSQKEIDRLAVLSRLKYEEQRKAIAKSIGISVTGLDAAVGEVRRSTGGQGKPLDLPEPKPWETAVEGKDLLLGLIAAVQRYMVMDETEVVATALWIIHCHAFRAFDITPRLAITSPEKQCGKTTLLDVLSLLVPRRLLTANVGAAATFRAIEMAQPTVLIDEADTFLNKNEELRGILNSGHRKGGSTLRCVGDNHEPRQFSTWSPVAIAMIGRLRDTLEDRSISVRLRRKRSSDKVERFRLEKARAGLEDLARKAARWVADNTSVLSAADPALPETMGNRAQDNWLPLIAIADAIGGEWPDKARRVAESMAVIASGDDQSVGAMLLADIRDIFTEKDADRLSSEDLLEALLTRDSRPWSEWKNGKPMTKAGLGRQLTKFGIDSENIRVGTRVPKGYYLHRFDDAFSRYLPPETATSLQANNDGHFLQNQTATLDPPVALSKCGKPLEDGDRSDVAVCGTPQGEKEETKDADGADDCRPSPKAALCAYCGRGGQVLECSAGGEAALLHRDCIDSWEQQSR